LLFAAESADAGGMETQKQAILAHPRGEQPMVEARSAIADTFAGCVYVE
jgi:hypothetical protein